MAWLERGVGAASMRSHHPLPTHAPPALRRPCMLASSALTAAACLAGAAAPNFLVRRGVLGLGLTPWVSVQAYRTKSVPLPHLTHPPSPHH